MGYIQSTVPITSCHKCKPEKWEVLGPAQYSYKCTGCKKIVKVVLREKKQQNSPCDACQTWDMPEACRYCGK